MGLIQLWLIWLILLGFQRWWLQKKKGGSCCHVTQLHTVSFFFVNEYLKKKGLQTIKLHNSANFFLFLFFFHSYVWLYTAVWRNAVRLTFQYLLNLHNSDFIKCNSKVHKDHLKNHKTRLNIINSSTFTIVNGFRCFNIESFIILLM